MGIYRSKQLQLLTATPTHSQSQSWHADNGSPKSAAGITNTLEIDDHQMCRAASSHTSPSSNPQDNVGPSRSQIVDFSIENGATQILPGSHRLLASFFRLLADGPRVITPRAGSIAVYDARLYHRGLGNATASSRPALVFRYDFEETPPPGVGIAGSVANIGLAKVLHAGTGAGAALREALFG